MDYNIFVMAKELIIAESVIESLQYEFRKQVIRVVMKNIPQGIESCMK